jgi:RecB family exonuclease
MSDTAMVRQAAEATFDALLETEAALLLTPGASDEKHQLRSELVEAAVALSALVREAKLEIVGVEVPVEAELPSGPLRGSIDLLLRDENGAEMVLDLKYGKATYVEKLKAGLAIQLAVYAEARRQHAGTEVPPPAGYFSLKHKALFATDAAGRFARQPQQGPPVSETWARADNTSRAAAATLAEGRIPVAGVGEVAKGSLLKMLGIGSEQAADHLALPAESACKYCSFGGVCGRSWEQPW